MGLFGSPPPTTAPSPAPIDPADNNQAFIPFPPTLSTPLADDAPLVLNDQSSEHLIEETSVAALPVVPPAPEVETIIPAPMVTTFQPVAAIAPTMNESGSSDTPFPKQVTEQVEAVLQQSIEDEQQEIEQERATLTAKQATIDQQKTQLEALRQSIGSQETAIKDQEDELTHRTAQLESREGRVAKVMQTLES